MSSGTKKKERLLLTAVDKIVPIVEIFCAFLWCLFWGATDLFISNKWYPGKHILLWFTPVKVKICNNCPWIWFNRWKMLLLEKVSYFWRLLPDRQEQPRTLRRMCDVFGNLQLLRLSHLKMCISNTDKTVAWIYAVSLLKLLQLSAFFLFARGLY